MRKIAVLLFIIIISFTGCSQGSKEVSNLNDEIKSLNEKITKVTDELNKKDEVISSLNGNKNDIKELNKELDDKEEIIKSFEDKMNFMNYKLSMHKSNNDIKDSTYEYVSPKNKNFYIANSLSKIPEIIEENINIDLFKTKILDETNKKELNIDLYEGYRIYNPLFIDDNTILFYANDTNDTYKDDLFYKYDIKNDNLSIFYIDDDFISTGESYSKKLNNGNIVFCSEKKILIFEKDSLKLLKSIIFPEEIKGQTVIISNNGDKIAYTSKEGMCVASLEFENPTLLIRDIGEELDAVVPGSFKWSHDDEKILYTLYGYEWTFGIGIIDIKTLSNKFYEKSDYYGKSLLSDNTNILASEAYDTKKFFIIDTDKNIEKAFISDEIIRYVSDSSPKRFKIPVIYINNHIYIIDIENNEKILVNKTENDLSFESWSPSSKNILLSKDHGEKLFVYTIE